MSKSKNSVRDDRELQEWAEEVYAATLGALQRAPGGDATKALKIVQLIVDMVRSGLNELDAAHLDRMHRAYQAIGSERIAMAENIVATHGTMLKEGAWVGRAQRPGGRPKASPERIAGALAWALCSHIDVRFGALLDDEQNTRVRDLLRRYEPDPHRRRTPKGTPSKLAASGILVELDKMAGNPLGKWSFSARGVANAKKRARAKR